MVDIVYDNIVSVNEGDRDVDTQMDIKFGDRLVFSAYGEIWAGVWFTGRNGPQGWDNIAYDRKFPLPGTHPYCLLGRLDGRLFYIGIGFDRFYLGRNSRLYLRINDDSPGNGDGSFFCHIQVYRESVLATRGLMTSRSQQKPAASPVASPVVSEVEKSGIEQ
jgi:hypothetical protein